MAGELTNMFTGATTSGADAGGFIAMMILMFVVVILFAIALYVYSALAWMTIAKKTKTEPAWLAWIPLANNVLISMIADMHWWPILLIIPAILFWILYLIFPSLIVFLVLYGLTILVFSLYNTIWTWKAFEKVGRPGWWAGIAFIVSLIATPLLLLQLGFGTMIGWVLTILGSIWSIVVLGIAAWGKTETVKLKRAVKSRKSR